MVRLRVTNSSVPVGSYVCQFTGTESVEHAEYGDGLKWGFQVMEGPLKGRDVFRTTKPTPTHRNSCGKFLAALAGTTPSDGLDIDTDDHVGDRYMVIVGVGQDGESTRIETFVPETDG